MSIRALGLMGWMLLLAAIPTVTFLVRAKRDATTWLSCYIVLLFGLSASLVLAPAGAIGTPAIGAGVAVAWMYWLDKLGGAPEIDRDLQPVRTALIFYLLWMLASSTSAYLRPLSALEISGSTREIVRLVVHTGIALAAADAIVSRERLDVLLRRLVFAGAFLSSIGVVQFATGVNVSQYLRPPGLSVHRETVTVLRSVFNRPQATALHPIELGVLLAMLLPIALHYAFYEPPGRRRNVAVGVAAVIAAGIPLTFSRSGIVALAVALVTLSTAWSWRKRANAAVVAAISTVAMYAVVPGLVGTIVGLFQDTEDDPSIQARIDRIPRMLSLLRQNLWFGRGFGTYNIEDYFLLDNEYFVTVIEVGVLGLVVVLGVILTGVFVARGVRHRGGDEQTRHLGQALASTLLAAAVTVYTFDAFFYHIFTGVVFLVIGCAGALWRFESDRARPQSTIGHELSSPRTAEPVRHPRGVRVPDAGA